MSKADREARSADEARSKDDDFLRKARERFKEAKEYWGKIYDPARENLRFFAGNSDNGYQWPDNIRLQRENDFTGQRPCLTINRLPQFHNQVVNDYRQSEIGIRAAAQEAEDKETADTYAGLFKQIEKESNAQLAYVKALSDGTIMGLGYIRALTRYASDESFNQDIFIDRVVNPFNHYPDPHAQGFFLEDSDYWFVLSKMTEDEYEDEYGGGDDAPDPTDFDSSDDDKDDWRDDKVIWVAEYFYFTRKKRELCVLSDGSTLWMDEIHKDHDKANVPIVKRRMVNTRVLNWCKIDGYNILEKSREWATPRIPIVPVWGNELWVGEERQITGMVAASKDSQRMYNYYQSTKTEMIALAPKAPYIAEAGQIEGYEDDWQSAANTPKSVLLYKARTVDGTIVPPPQRQMYEAPVQAIIQASMQSSDDMKASLGIYDASLGAKGNEVSGRAINARKQQGATATYNYVDNLSLGIGYIGRIVGELIPKTYDTKRILRIVGENGQTKRVTVNAESGQDEQGNKSPNIVDIKYDLVLDTGPSFGTQREESTALLTELSRNYPKIMDVAGDIAVRGMNFIDADKVADRLKRTLPPNVVGDDEDPTTKLAAALTMADQLKSALQATNQVNDKLAEQAKLDKVNLANKAGENKIRMKELGIKEIEAEAKLVAAIGTAEKAGAENAVNEGLDTLHRLVAEIRTEMTAHGAAVDALANPEPFDAPDEELPPGPPAAPEAPGTATEGATPPVEKEAPQ